MKIAWQFWRDTDLLVSREEITRAYTALEYLDNECDDLPESIIDALDDLRRAVKRIEALDADRERELLHAWRACAPIKGGK